jgi:hypothetical protein
MKKFEYYKHLRSLGIKEEHAISMTEQAKRLDAESSPSLAVCCFTEWKNTKEGSEFWYKLYHSYR